MAQATIKQLDEREISKRKARKADLSYWLLIPDKNGNKESENSFRGKEVRWQEYTLFDESHNMENRVTSVAVMPWRFTLKDEEDFKKKFFNEASDPYIKFYRMNEKTIIHHCKNV